MSEQLLQEAATLVSKSKFVEALEVYTKVIITETEQQKEQQQESSSSSAINIIKARAYNNRSMCNLELRNYEQAVDDATFCTELAESKTLLRGKGFLRKASALERYRRFSLAADNYRLCAKEHVDLKEHEVRDAERLEKFVSKFSPYVVSSSSSSETKSTSNNNNFVMLKILLGSCVTPQLKDQLFSSLKDVEQFWKLSIDELAVSFGISDDDDDKTNAKNIIDSILNLISENWPSFSEISNYNLGDALLLSNNPASFFATSKKESSSCDFGQKIVHEICTLRPSTFHTISVACRLLTNYVLYANPNDMIQVKRKLHRSAFRSFLTSTGKYFQSFMEKKKKQKQEQEKEEENASSLIEFALFISTVKWFCDAIVQLLFKQITKEFAVTFLHDLFVDLLAFFSNEFSSSSSTSFSEKQQEHHEIVLEKIIAALYALVAGEMALGDSEFGNTALYLYAQNRNPTADSAAVLGNWSTEKMRDAVLSEKLISIMLSTTTTTSSSSSCCSASSCSCSDTNAVSASASATSPSSKNKKDKLRKSKSQIIERYWQCVMWLSSGGGMKEHEAAQVIFVGRPLRNIFLRFYSILPSERAVDSFSWSLNAFVVNYDYGASLFSEVPTETISDMFEFLSRLGNQYHQEDIYHAICSIMEEMWKHEKMKEKFGEDQKFILLLCQMLLNHKIPKDKKYKVISAACAEDFFAAIFEFCERKENRTMLMKNPQNVAEKLRETCLKLSVTFTDETYGRDSGIPDSGKGGTFDAVRVHPMSVVFNFARAIDLLTRIDEKTEEEEKAILIPNRKKAFGTKPFLKMLDDAKSVALKQKTEKETKLLLEKVEARLK